MHILLSPEGQSVVSLIVDPEASSLILAWSHPFIEFYHEILSTVSLLLQLIQEELCHLQTQVWARPLVKLDQEKSV